MIRGTTSSGFRYEVNEQILKDYRFVRNLSKIRSKDEIKALDALTEAISLFLGEEQEEALAEHLINEDGVVLSEDLVREFNEIVVKASEASKEVKN